MLSLNTVNLYLRFVCTCNSSFRPLNKTVIKNLSSKSSTSVKNTNQGKKIDVKLGKYDYVGPPHEKANIRPLIFYCHDRETRLETLYRQNREETQDWNITFWSHHNEKASFVKKKLQEKYANNYSSSEPKSLTAEEMSVFYKSFLDENLRTHSQYNKEWYKRNFKNLYLAFLIVLEKIFKRKL
ncbi:Apoptogenic protein 1, mitochondrial [Armadillidium nasatum]|uniref:Apoptogenic protein 1, mitochondrial n=1 Tax=Armadillidium nasatum TaxID=96803 RepID=A0A5N5SWG2_9CRUS|nr:Apoptogenic protein 1, mitochondrial [Armadillidium nasatum]